MPTDNDGESGNGKEEEEEVGDDHNKEGEFGELDKFKLDKFKLAFLEKKSAEVQELLACTARDRTPIRSRRPAAAAAAPPPPPPPSPSATVKNGFTAASSV